MAAVFQAPVKIAQSKLPFLSSLLLSLLVYFEQSCLVLERGIVVEWKYRMMDLDYYLKHMDPDFPLYRWEAGFEDPF